MMASSASAWIISHLGFVLKFDISRKDGNLSLECKILRFNSSGPTEHHDKRQGYSATESSASSASKTRPNFEETESLFLQLEHCKSARVIALQKCLDASTFITRPYALIQKKTAQSTVRYQCVAVLDDGVCELQLQTSGEFAINNVNLRRLPQNNVRFIDGPSVLWLDTSTNILGQVCLESESCGQVVTELCENKSMSNYKLLESIAVKSCPLTEVLLLGVCDCIEERESSDKSDEATRTGNMIQQEFFAVVLKKTGLSYEHLVLGKQHICKVIPHEYSSIVCSIAFRNVDIDVEKPAGDGGTGIQLSRCRSDLYVCTTQRHVLEFSNGRLVRCVNVESACISTMVTVQCHQLEPYLCLWSESDRVFVAVRCQDLEVKTVHREVDHMIVGDFLGNGTDQMMLLSAKPPTWPPVSCVLTDFGPSYTESLKEQVPSTSTSQSDSSSVQAAIKALQVRLQCDVVRLEELARGVEERERLLGLACDTVQRLTLNQEPSLPHQPDLVPLLGGTDYPESACTPATSSQPLIGQKFLEVKDTWQRLCDGRWVIGVDVCNVSDSVLSHVSLSACLPSHVGLEKDNQLSVSVWPANQCRGAGVTCNQSGMSSHAQDWIFQPTASKLRRFEQPEDRNSKMDKLLPGEKTTLICVLSQPLFGVHLKDCLLLFLNLCPSCTKHEKSRTTEPQMFTVFCGKVEFSKEDLYGSKHTIDLRCPEARDTNDVDLQRSRQCLDASQERVKLIVMSTQTGLTDVVRALTRAGFTHQPLYDCYLCPRTMDNFSWVRLQLSTVTTTTRPSVCVWCRNKALLWSFLHYLYHILPDDVVMVTEDQDTAVQTERLKSAAQALRSEADFSMAELSELIEKYIKDDDVMEIDSEDTVDKLSENDGAHVIRGNFSRMQQNVQCLRKEGIISNEHFRKFLSRLQEYMEISDTEVLRLSTTS